MGHQTINPIHGHWLLAKMGKRVLRPGGAVLTHKMIADLGIGAGDEVVELAPGLGYTAALLLLKNLCPIPESTSTKRQWRSLR